MTSDEVIERVADWLNAFKADPFATGGDKASALLELVGTLAALDTPSKQLGNGQE